MDFNIKALETRAKRLRKEVLDFSVETGLTHFGGSFSAVEVLTALYKEVMREDDRFILSKGHACPPLYVLLREKGLNPTISGHPDIDPENGISCTTGSLGHGLPYGIGMAFAKKLAGKSGHTYVLMSDGEVQEGTTWESLLHGSRLGLNNLTAILDHNKIQSSDFVENIVPFGDLAGKFRAFDWKVSEINGHSFDEIVPALYSRDSYKPHMIIAHTTKGKGVSFMENSAAWHSAGLTPELLAKAYGELS